jgi:SAM-dependent methyltransferase
LLAVDWDAYWRYELFRRSADPLDFRKWKRDSQRELAALHPGGKRLLDSSAGLGDHTVNLAEVGFRVDACDTSEVALEATRRAVADAGVDVEVFRARWESIGRDGRYDLIFNDALHWTYDEDELLAVLRGLRAALAPGGALVFFFADEREPEPGAGLRILEWDSEGMERERLAWKHTVERRTVALTITSERGPDFIDEHHRYDVEEPDGTRGVETLTVRRVYRWDWHGISPLLCAAGFRDVRCDHFENVKGYTYAMNRAFV